MQKIIADKNNPREIPTRQDPDRNYPEKAPGTEPGRDNPRNPQDDEAKKLKV